MKKETVISLENTKGPGLNNFLAHLLNKSEHDEDNIFVVETINSFNGEAALVVKGSAPVEERRELFIKIMDGISNISDFIKKDLDLNN